MSPHLIWQPSEYHNVCTFLAQLPHLRYWFKFFPTLGSEIFSCSFNCCSNRWISPLRLVKAIVNLNITCMNIFIKTYQQKRVDSYFLVIYCNKKKPNNADISILYGLNYYRENKVMHDSKNNMSNVDYHTALALVQK